MDVRPPGLARTLWILVRMGVRRWLNRPGWTTPLELKRGGGASAGGPRRGTPGKRTRGKAVRVFFTLAMALMFASWGFLFPTSVRYAVEGRLEADRVAVHPELFHALKSAAQSWGDPPRPGNQKEASTYLRDLLDGEEGWEWGGAEGFSPREIDEIVAVFLEKGTRGFRVDPRKALSDDEFALESFRDQVSSLPADKESRAIFAAALAILLVFAWIYILSESGGGRIWTQENAAYELEWLATFPVPETALFLARILEGALTSGGVWVTLVPFTSAVLFRTGWGWAALPAGVLASVSLVLPAVAVRVACVTWARTRLSVRARKTAGALVQMAAGVGLLAAYAALLAPDATKVLVSVACRLPLEFLWNPITLPALATLPGDAGRRALFLLMPVTLAVTGAALMGCRWFVRDGLTDTLSEYAGTRRGPRGRPAAMRLRVLRGVLWKDALRMLRDPPFLLQVFLVPVVIVAFTLVLNPDILSGAVSDFRHAALLAYFVGSYAALMLGMSALAAEGLAAWILVTLPVPLTRVLAHKAVFSAAVGIFHASLALAVVFGLSGGAGWEAAIPAATALIGVGINAFLAVSLSTLTADAFRKYKSLAAVSLPLFVFAAVAGPYSWALYAPDLGRRITLVILFAGVAPALWESMRYRLPYLFDPTDSPPPRLTVADGLVAVLYFCVLQEGIALGLPAVALEPSLKTALVFVIAGSFVFLGSLCAFAFRGIWIGDLARAIGLVGGRGPVRAALAGTAAGLAASLAAVLYVASLRSFEILAPLRQWFDRESAAYRLSGMELHWDVLFVSVVLAPPFVEYLFRGLVYRTVRSAAGVKTAVLLSAALFAIVHPAAAMFPAFGLGIASAFAFERTGTLLAPVACHAVYNLAGATLCR